MCAVMIRNLSIFGRGGPKATLNKIYPKQRDEEMPRLLETRLSP